MSPLQRSKRLLEAEGWHVSIVEHWNAFARIRQDLWNFADLLCLKSLSKQIMAVQVTSRSHVSTRVAKIEASPLLTMVKDCGILVEVHGWGKLKGKGWDCRRVEL